MKKILFLIFLIFPLSVFAATEKTYSITNDTANGKVYVPSLVKEINDASVGVTLDHINTDQDSDALLIVFQSDLSVWTKVDAVVAAHTGIQIKSKTVYRESGVITIANGSQKGSITVTHNLQDDAGNLLTPNSVNVCVCKFTVNSTSIEDTVLDHRTVFPATENGTFELIMVSSKQNTSGKNWSVNYKLVAEYSE